MAQGGRYLHQQIGWVTLLLLLVVALIIYVAFQQTGAAIVGSLALLIPILVAFLFGTLTVEVDRERLRIRYGVGLIRKSWAIRDIASAAAVRNPWYTGWGIRLLPSGVVYNVGGFDAVEVTMESGKRFRIGTDEPAELERAIRARVNAARR